MVDEGTFNLKGVILQSMSYMVSDGRLAVITIAN